jgi:hypothetical protein
MHHDQTKCGMPRESLAPDTETQLFSEALRQTCFRITGLPFRREDLDAILTAWLGILSQPQPRNILNVVDLIRTNTG